jgi:PqqD family protein of HPr-rel-A system
MTSDITRWQVSEPRHFVLLDFDDGSVLFDRRSGQTHVLNAASAEAFGALSATALTEPQLARRLLDLVEGEVPDDFERTVSAIIRRFEMLGLVDRVDG